MPLERIKTEVNKLSNILDKDVIADKCTAGELQKVHDQFQKAIISGDPAKLIRENKLSQQLLAFDEINPTVSKVIKDLVTALSSMGI